MTGARTGAVTVGTTAGATTTGAGTVVTAGIEAVKAAAMIHLHMEVSCIAANNPHDAAFHKYADRICKIHEFDRLIF